MDQKKTGKFIAFSRKNKNLTQEELAFRLGVSDRTIGNWENGRNMPDLSLFKPLCDELSITINELISGEKIDDFVYQQKADENMFSTISYTNKKIIQKNNLIGLILVVFGFLISFCAMCMFESESSFGSAFSVLGAIMSLIGFSRLTKSMVYFKRLLFNFGYFIFFIVLLFVIDFLGVINIKQAPRFSLKKISTGNSIYYDTIFYDVFRCDCNLKTESWHVEKNKDNDYFSVAQYCDNVNKERLKLMLTSAKNTNHIVISKYVENIQENKTYINDLSGSLFEIVKSIKNEKEVSEFLKILNRGKYSSGINLIRDMYLFQLFNDENLILEFTNNYIQNDDYKFGFYFDDSDGKLLESFIK